MEQKTLKKRYVIHDVIGKGGMAIVYLGFNLDNGEKVAVKMLREEHASNTQLVRRFHKEAEITLGHSHRNIVNTLDVGEDQGIPYIIMEYVQGQTLKSYIEKKGALPYDEAIGIALQVCLAMEYAHSIQLIHRDIKPHNILLGSDGGVKVADFGIAKFADHGTMTLGDSSVLGSVHYLSPEQAQGFPTDSKSDLYSLGIVLYEMVTGTVPFTGESLVSVAMKHVQEDVVFPRMRNPHVPPSLEGVILKAIEKKPEERYASAQELAQDLRRCLTDYEGWFVPKDRPAARQNRGEGAQPAPPRPVSRPPAAVGIPPRQPAIMAQPPARRQGKSRVYWMMSIGVLGVLVALGVMVFSFAPRIAVPSLVGASLDTAQNTLSSKQLYSIVDYEPSIDVPRDQVLKQVPDPGKRVRMGQHVQLTVSAGPQVVKAPKLVGLSREEAEKKLSDFNLKEGDLRQEDSNLPKGMVTKQDPEPGADIGEGAKINLWLSRGPQTESLPLENFYGQSKDDVESYLVSLQLQCEVIEEVNDNPAGIVFQQEPKATTLVQPGDKVKIWVSKGQGYIYDFTQTLELNEDGGVVTVSVNDDGMIRQVYEVTHNQTDTELDISLHFDTKGTKTVSVYVDEVLYITREIKVTG